jgi:hypothetical protein
MARRSEIGSGSLNAWQDFSRFVGSLELKSSAALTGLEFIWLVNPGLALGYYLSGFQPSESAFISVHQRLNPLRSMRSLAAK